ncbi:MAG TPA: hypothetical protein VFV38_32780 [Ktedonobacteraceae bacterium]|nr:hypothetical protein [Ktedonobacteraceae bacterium]
MSLEEVDAAWSFQRAWWPGLLPLLRSSYELLPRGQAIGRARVIDLLHLFTQAEPIKLLIQEQEPISLFPWSGARMSNPVHQCAGHGFDVSVAVSYLLAQNMKDEDGFLSPCWESDRQVENGHSRMEIREYWTLSDPEILAYLNPEQQWKACAAFFSSPLSLAS